MAEELQIKLGLDTRAFDKGLREATERLGRGSTNAGQMLGYQFRQGGLGGVAGALQARVGMGTAMGIGGLAAGGLAAALVREMRHAMGLANKYREQAVMKQVGVGELGGVPGATQHFVRELERATAAMQEWSQMVDLTRGEIGKQVASFMGGAATDVKRGRFGLHWLAGQALQAYPRWSEMWTDIMDPTGIQTRQLTRDQQAQFNARDRAIQRDRMTFYNGAPQGVNYEQR